MPTMYEQYASWFHLITAPWEYADEAVSIAVTVDSLARREVRTMLELGSGGGNNASFLKRRYEMTLVDLSPAMLAISREINPECEHLVGDMRTVRLERAFDAVLIHDAIMYVTTEDDLRAAIRTAAAHLAPGGVALFVPDDVAETFQPRTEHGGHDGEDGRAARYLEWEFEPDGTLYRVVFALLLQDADGSVQVALDEHTVGLFPRDTWMRLIEGEGLEARAVPALYQTGGVFAGIKPGAA